MPRGKHIKSKSTVLSYDIPFTVTDLIQHELFGKSYGRFTLQRPWHLGEAGEKSKVI